MYTSVNSNLNLQWLVSSGSTFYVRVKHNVLFFGLYSYIKVSHAYTLQRQ